MKKILIAFMLVGLITSCTKEVEVEKIVYQEDLSKITQLQSQLVSLQQELRNSNSENDNLEDEITSLQNQLSNLDISYTDALGEIQNLKDKVRFESFYRGQESNYSGLTASNNVTIQNYPLIEFFDAHIKALRDGLWELQRNVNDGIISYQDGIDKLYDHQGNYGDLSTFITTFSGKWYGNNGQKVLISDQGIVQGFTQKWSSPTESGITLHIRPSVYSTDKCWDEYYSLQLLINEIRWFSYGKSRPYNYIGCEFGEDLSWDYKLSKLSLSQVRNDLIGITRIAYTNK